MSARGYQTCLPAWCWFQMAPLPPLVSICSINTPEILCVLTPVPDTQAQAHSRHWYRCAEWHTLSGQLVCQAPTEHPDTIQPDPAQGTDHGVGGAHHEQMLSRCHVMCLPEACCRDQESPGRWAQHGHTEEHGHGDLSGNMGSHLLHHF